MSQHPLANYIQEAKNKGISTAEILEALTKAGWRIHEIADILLQHSLISVVPEKAGSAEAIITVQNVSKHYGKVVALDNVSLEVKRGSVTALLGPNGAGKTTLVRVLSTLLIPTDGTAIVDGFDVVRDAKKLRSTIGLAGQTAAVDEILTGRENLEMFGRLYHLTKQQAKARAIELLKQFDLEDAADRVLKNYSGGMRRRLDLAASLIMKPQVLFLDEPTTGLDPRSRFMMWEVIRELVAGGTTVMLTTQYLEEADQLADYIFVIDHGHIIAQGTANELKNQVGGDVLELHMTNHFDAERAATAVRQFGSEPPHADSNSGIITMPISGGASVLVNVVRQLDSVDLKVNDVMLRRPSLDDVFMKLTGHASEEK